MGDKGVPRRAHQRPVELVVYGHRGPARPPARWHPLRVASDSCCAVMRPLIGRKMAISPYPLSYSEKVPPERETWESVFEPAEFGDQSGVEVRCQAANFTSHAFSRGAAATSTQLLP